MFWPISNREAASRYARVALVERRTSPACGIRTATDRRCAQRRVSFGRERLGDGHQKTIGKITFAGVRRIVRFQTARL